MKAQWHGQVVAESADVIELGGYSYFPRDSVRLQLLTASPRTADDLRCPHGVQFFDLADGPATSERAAWSYESPLSEYARIGHRIGFWKDVELTR